MTDEQILTNSLDLLVPASETIPEWEDVLRRARITRRPTRQRVLLHTPTRRRLGLALALVAAAVLVAVTTPVGAAVARGLGDFSGWLTGHPGTPAPTAEQQRFEAANGLSWAAFPQTTKLRELIRADVDGKRYVLYGFRSGDSLCLRLQAVSLGHSTQPGCAPLSTLSHVSAPMVVVVGNDGFADLYNHPSAQFSYGIVADTVKRVDVTATDGTHRAFADDNAYLWVENEPNTGNHVLSISATSAGGRRKTLTLPNRNWLDLPAAPLRPRGPARIEARLAHPRIGWLARGEHRGVTLAQARLTPQQRRDLSRWSIDTLLKPDPLSDIVVGVSQGARGGCVAVVGSGVGCGPLFERGPIQALYSGGNFNRSDQFAAIAGVAADGVARIRVFLADGETQTAALRNNAFSALLPSRPPFRIVAYDGRGRVVGIETFPSFMAGRAAPRAATAALRPILHVAGPNGATATLRSGRTVDRVRCWRVDYSNGQHEQACEQRYETGPQIWVRTVQPAGRDLFILGGVRKAVARVELRFADGSTISTRPRDGLFLLAVPRAQLRAQRQLAYVIGIDRQGHHAQRQSVLFRAPPAR